MTYPVKFFSRFCLFLALLLSACAPQMVESQNEALPTLARPLQLAQNPTAYPAVQPSATAAPSATALPTAAPTATLIPTIAATATTPADTGSVIDTTPFEACDNPPMYEASYPLADPAGLHWQAANVQGQAYQMLAGLSVPPVNASPAPDGRWWMVDLLQQPGQGGPAVTALYMVDTLEGKHWLVSKQGWDVEHRYNWLADNRLLWVDEGHLYLSGLDGQNRQDLAAPAAVREVWAAQGEQGKALVTDGDKLWRLDVASGQWAAVDGVPPLSSGSYNINLSPDGADAALMLSGQIWKVPMSGGAAQKLAEIQYGGRGGRINAPEPLANSPYWGTGEMILGASGSAVSLLDTRDGRILSPAEIAPALSGSPSVGGPAVSTDRRWVAFILQDGETPKGVYIAPSDNLQSGKVYPGRAVAGWRAQPDMAYLLSTGDTPQIIQIDLTSGEQKTLGAWVSDIENMQRLLTPPNLTVIISGGQVQRFKLDGTLQDQWAAPKFTFAFPSWANAGPTGDLFFYGTTAQKVDGACQVTYRLLLHK